MAKKIFFKVKCGLFPKGKKQILFVLIASLIMSLLIIGGGYLAETRTAQMVLTLNYANARNGLTPTGSRFNIAEIKSDEVLQRAIDIMGDDSLYVEGVKPRILINTKLPQSSIDRTISAISADLSYSYCPSEFTIVYSQKNKLAKNRSKEFLEALAKAYTEYFNDKYSEKNTILDFNLTDDIKNYDYIEAYQVLYDKVGEMLVYIDRYEAEDKAFRSSSTGYSFTNLASMLINIRDVDLEKYNAFVIQNGISKDHDGFLRKQQYNAESKEFLYRNLQEASDIYNFVISEYNSHITGVAFIPSLDMNKEFYMSRTKTGLDALVLKSQDYGTRAKDMKKTLDRHNYLVEKFSTKPESTREQKQAADAMISSICDSISKISSLAIQTDNDYIENKENNYVTYIYPERGMMKYAKGFVLLMAICLVGFTALLHLRSKLAEKFNKQKAFLIKVLKLTKEDSEDEN